MTFSCLTRIRRLIALTALLLSISFTWAFAQSSYIIVHCHNPEGKEIASIQGMSRNSVEIYDGDTRIGYGAYNAATHNQPITIDAGSHTIKVKFNGISLRQDVNIETGETKKIIFAFERESLDITSLLTYSITESSSAEGWSTVWNAGGFYAYRFWIASFSDFYGGVGYVNPNPGGPSWTTITQTKIVTITPSNMTGKADFFISWDRLMSWCIWSVDLSTNERLIDIPAKPFSYWFVQLDKNWNLDQGYYYGVEVLSESISYPLVPGGPYDSLYPGKCYMIPAIHYTILKFPSLGDVGQHGYLDEMSNPSGQSSYTATKAYQGVKNLLGYNTFVSSVPYDLLGTGVKDGEEKLPPVATFVYSPEKPSVGEEITFDASASNDPDGTIVKYEWDFGDGTTAEGIQVIHAYAKDGEYTITLTVTDNDGLTGSTELSLIVKSSFDLEILDGADFSAGREISSDAERIVSTKGVPVEGAVTDGVTRLLLKVNTDTPDIVTFSLEGTGNPNEDGLLRPLDGSQQGSSITVNTVNTSDGEKAFAIYQAPENFVRRNYAEDRQASERKILLKVKSARLPASELSEEIKLLRPPLILIHGLWSKPEMWDDFKTILKNKIQGIQIYTVDYKKKNSNYLEDNKDVPYSCKGDSITKARQDLRSQGIAMVQADIVGHSMGGLLARIWAGTKEYWRDNNFKTGNINKFITLDSPHYGSFLADAAIQLVRNPRSVSVVILMATMEDAGFSLTKGAVEDLMTTSVPIDDMNRTEVTVPTHTISGEYTGASLAYYTDPDGTVRFIIEGIPLDYLELHNLLIDQGYGNIIIPPIIYSGSDLVVSRYSQQGGLSTYASNSYNHHHMAATTQDVATRVIELLNTDTNSNLFNTGFPASE